MKSRGLVSALPHAGGGTVPNIALAFRLSATPLADPTAAPTLGQHTEQILHEILGYLSADINELAERGVILIPGTDRQSG